MNVAYLLRGNAYAVCLRDGRGQPTELIPVNPDAVMVLEAADGSIFYNTNKSGSGRSRCCATSRRRSRPRTCCICAA